MGKDHKLHDFMPGMSEGRPLSTRRICSRRSSYHCSPPRGDKYCQSPHHLPTQRPLAEPPMLDYDNVIENELPSDIRFSKLFPNDIERWVRCRDVETERLILTEYLDWALNMQCYDGDKTRTEFYKDLWAELWIETDEVNLERNSAFTGVSTLGLWEFSNLDQGGGMKGIEAWLWGNWESVKM